MATRRPRRLQAEATLDILRGRPDTAISTLSRLQSLEPNSPEILNDLGTAYYLRSQQKALDETDRVEAVNWLAKAYQQSLPKPPPYIVFNYALALENAHLMRRAKEMWAKYLELDNRSKWADEARTHEQNISNLIKLHSPGEFSTTGPSEPFIDAAPSWLAAAFPLHGPANPEAGERLELLSRSLLSQHEDDWLRQLLASRGDLFSQAVHEMAAASADNTNSQYQSAGRHAASAARLFVEDANEAGWAYSQYEGIYALQRLAQGAACLRSSDALAARLRGVPFRWIEIQNLLEMHACAQMAKLIPPPEAGLQNITEQADRFRYDSLGLRAQGFLADEKAAENVRGDCIRASMTGLAIYWDHPYEKPARAFNLYQALAELAEDAESWELAYDFNLESALTLSPGAYPLEVASAWTRAAEAATILHRRQEARIALDHSQQILRQVLEQETVALYAADNALWEAQLELQQNKVGEARRALQLASNLLPRDQSNGAIAVENYTISIPYYTLQARLAIAQGEWSLAEGDLKEARREEKRVGVHSRLITIN